MGNALQPMVPRQNILEDKDQGNSGMTIEIPRIPPKLMNHATASIAPEKETREERLIRIRYQQILKQEERDRKKKDKIQQKLEEVTKEPLVSIQISN